MAGNRFWTLYFQHNDVSNNSAFARLDIEVLIFKRVFVIIECLESKVGCGCFHVKAQVTQLANCSVTSQSRDASYPGIPLLLIQIKKERI